MSVLCELPADILSSITSFLEGQEICDLWLCGNKSLNEILSKYSGVTSFRLRIFSSRPLMYPKLIYNFSYLQSLQLCLTLHPNLEDFSLACLPVSLTRLELDFHNSFEYFLRVPPVNLIPPSKPSSSSPTTKLALVTPAAVPVAKEPSVLAKWFTNLLSSSSAPVAEISQPQITPKQEPTDHEPESSESSESSSSNVPSNLPSTAGYAQLPKYHDLSKLLPKLNTLTIRGSGKIMPDIVSAFPKTLTSLSVTHRTTGLPISIISLLPPNLVHLSLYNNSAAFLNSLPGQDSNKTAVSLAKPDILASLQFPPHLESFSVSMDRRDAEVLSNLPQSLQRLQLDIYDPTQVLYMHQNIPVPTWWQWLPRNLTSLKTNAGTLQHNFSELPRSLLFLDLQDRVLNHLDPEQVKNFPPKLLDIKATSLSLSSESVQYLPRNLTTLSLRHASPQVFTSLPPKLTQLTLSEIFDGKQMDLLPSSITDLDIIRLTDDGVGGLPPNLTSLSTFQGTQLSAEGIKNLPQTLIYLKLPTDAFQDKDCLEYLPVNLRTLILETGVQDSKITPESSTKLPKRLEKFAIYGKETPSAFNDVWFSGLGGLEKLQELSILGTNPDCTADALLHLPPNLTMLNLKIATSMQSAHITALPRNLRKLEISSRKSTTLLNADLRSLPSSLIHILLPESPKVVPEGCKPLLPLLTRTFSIGWKPINIRQRK